MTLNQLHKQLGKLIEQGHGRRDIYINKSSFREQPRGRWRLHLARVRNLDSRGYIKTRTSLVIYGNCRESEGQS